MRLSRSSTRKAIFTITFLPAPSIHMTWAFLHVLSLHLNKQILPANTISQSCLCCQTWHHSPLCCQLSFQAFYISSTPSSPSSSSSGPLARISPPPCQTSRILLPPSPPPVSWFHQGVSCSTHSFISSTNITSSWWSLTANDFLILFVYTAINLPVYSKQ